jgi:two-component system chemotaxis sensor kinase CheA
MEHKLTFDITPDELEIFLEDANECLQAMETGILQLEQQRDPEMLNSIFRAAHTLKALAGTVGHRQMADLTHVMETIFSEMREDRLSPTQVIIDELLLATDFTKALRDEIVTQQPSGVEIADLLARLHALTGADDRQGIPLSPGRANQLTPDQAAELKERQAAGQTILEIEVAAAKEAFAPAARLYQAALALMETGQIVAQCPAPDSFSEDDERLWLLLATERPPHELETILSQIGELAEFHLQPYPSEPSTQQPASSHSVSPALPGENKKKVEGANPNKGEGAAPGKGEGTVRISVERLDTLMNLVGELVTNRTRLLQIEDMLRLQYGKDSGVGSLSELVPHFSHVIDQLQEEVMRARMLPIGSLFNKFPRLVRNLARQAGKSVELIIAGETTELDRAVIEAINDPLIHLLRNAVDHGLEPPDKRLAAGKPPTGTIHLTANSVEGQILITLTDDGRGIDPNQIRQATLDHQLLTEEEITQLTEDELIDLIFQPNLSTAAEVTEMSGRGVGLDVVRTNIERLSGSVLVTSEIGQGTTFQLTLPLTLALIQTMLVSVGNTLYALPVTGVNGAMYLAEANINTIKGRPALEWQGATIPLLDLREFFFRIHPVTQSTNGRKPSVVLVNWGRHRVGLAVDKIIGQQEIVVKSLSPLIGRSPGLAGATILGDGRIALIIDIPGLINAALRSQRAS